MNVGAVGEDGGEEPGGAWDHGQLDLVDMSAQSAAGWQPTGDGAGKSAHPLTRGRPPPAAHALGGNQPDADSSLRGDQEAHGRQGPLGNPVGDAAQSAGLGPDVAQETAVEGAH